MQAAYRCPDSVELAPYETPVPSIGGPANYETPVPSIGGPANYEAPLPSIGGPANYETPSIAPSYEIAPVYDQASQHGPAMYDVPPTIPERSSTRRTTLFSPDHRPSRASEGEYVVTGESEAQYEYATQEDMRKQSFSVHAAAAVKDVGATKRMGMVVEDLPQGYLTVISCTPKTEPGSILY